MPSFREQALETAQRAVAREAHEEQLKLLNSALEKENVRLAAENAEQRETIKAQGARIEVLNTMVEVLRGKLGAQDELLIELQQVIAGFEKKAVFEWPKQSKLNPKLQKQILFHLEMGDIAALLDLFDHEIRYDDKLRTMLRHRYFKDEVLKVYGRHFKRRGVPGRRGSDTEPGIPLGATGATTMGFGPGAGMLGVLFIDIDDFKRLNDTRGHLAGDAALKKVADVISESLREADIKGRFGGEELEIAVELENEFDHQRVAEKIRKAISEAVVEYEGEKFGVTVSIGSAMLQPPGMSPDDADPELRLDRLIDRANWAMKYAKAHGKNQSAPAEADEIMQWVEAAKSSEYAKTSPTQPRA